MERIGENQLEAYIGEKVLTADGSGPLEYDDGLGFFVGGHQLENSELVSIRHDGCFHKYQLCFENGGELEE